MFYETPLGLSSRQWLGERSHHLRNVWEIFSMTLIWQFVENNSFRK